MGVFLNMAFDDGSVVALWRITESEGKSLSEQRLAVDALIDSVFEGKYRLSHNDEGVPALEVVSGSKTAHQRAAISHDSKNEELPAPFVSVSHTKGWVAVMTNPKEHVGIDIELSGRDFSAVGKKAMSDSELTRMDGWTEALENSLPADTDSVTLDTNATPSGTPPVLNPRNTVLGLLWCAKEAVYKRLTVPATDFANQIEIECIVPTATDKVKITAIFKDKTGGDKIHLNCLLLPSILIVHTID